MTGSPVPPNLLGASLTPTGLDIDPDTSVEAWEELGQHLGTFRDATAWGIADWLIFGERAFGEDRVAQAVEVTGRSKSTLVKYRWIGEHVAPDRRRPGLTFTHHEIVARLPLEIADAWLDECEAQGWSVEELRGHVRPDKEPKTCTCVTDPECPRHGHA